MNVSVLRTLAAGLTACACLSGLSQSVNAQFFSHDTSIRSGNSRLPAISQSDLYDLRISQQRQDQQRYLRTNTTDDLQPRGKSSHGRCADGQCSHPHKNGFNETDTHSKYVPRRRSQDYDSAARYQPRSRLTGWDPANQPLAPTTNQPAPRPHRQGQTDGQSQRGHCHGGACSIDQHDHHDGQDRQQYRYDDFSLTRRSAPTSNYLPIRNSYPN